MLKKWLCGATLLANALLVVVCFPETAMDLQHHTLTLGLRLQLQFPCQDLGRNPIPEPCLESDLYLGRLG